MHLLIIHLYCTEFMYNYSVRVTRPGRPNDGYTLNSGKLCMSEEKKAWYIYPSQY